MFVMIRDQDGCWVERMEIHSPVEAFGSGNKIEWDADYGEVLWHTILN
jgi:hypothetical protein